MFKKMMKKEGFTLIELMIVVAIIGILAAIAIPNFMNYQCKARQSEAKSNLGNIRTALEAYKAEFGSYNNNLTTVGFSTQGKTMYSYVISTTGTGMASTFTITATSGNGGIKSADGDDVWTMDDQANLVRVTNACE